MNGLCNKRTKTIRYKVFGKTDRQWITSQAFPRVFRDMFRCKNRQKFLELSTSSTASRDDGWFLASSSTKHITKVTKVVLHIDLAPIHIDLLYLSSINLPGYTTTYRTHIIRVGNESARDATGLLEKIQSQAGDLDLSLLHVYLATPPVFLHLIIFDKLINDLTGMGSVYTAHGIMLQEIHDDEGSINEPQTIQRSGKRSMDLHQLELPECYVTQKKSPQITIEKITYSEGSIAISIDLINVRWFISFLCYLSYGCFMIQRERIVSQWPNLFIQATTCLLLKRWGG